MSDLLARIRARLGSGHHAPSHEETGWVRRALENMQVGPVNSTEATEGAEKTLENCGEGDFNGDMEHEKGILDVTIAGEIPAKEPADASQVFWETGALDGPIPNNFYVVTLNPGARDQFSSLPKLSELGNLRAADVADVIRVSPSEDQTLAKVFEFAQSLVKGLEGNQTLMVRKLAEVVADFFGGALFELPLARLGPADDSSNGGSCPVFLLGQLRTGSCRPRAMLLKFLFDAVGIRSRLLTGLLLESAPSSSLICSRPGDHMTNIVSANGLEALVDLMRRPGQLRPFSPRTLLGYHISAAGDSDSNDYDSPRSCDSPMELEPNSPFFGYNDKPGAGGESPEHEVDSSPRMRFSHAHRARAGPPAPGLVLPPQSSNHGRPPAADALASPSATSDGDSLNGPRRRTRRRALSDERSVISSPEHSQVQRRFPRGRPAPEDVSSIPSSPELQMSSIRSFRRMRSEDGSIPSSPDQPVPPAPRGARGPAAPPPHPLAAAPRRGEETSPETVLLLRGGRPLEQTGAPGMGMGIGGGNALGLRGRVAVPPPLPLPLGDDSDSALVSSPEHGGGGAAAGPMTPARAAWAVNRSRSLGDANGAALMGRTRSLDTRSPEAPQRPPPSPSATAAVGFPPSLHCHPSLAPGHAPPSTDAAPGPSLPRPPPSLHTIAVERPGLSGRASPREGQGGESVAESSRDGGAQAGSSGGVEEGGQGGWPGSWGGVSSSSGGGSLGPAGRSMLSGGVGRGRQAGEGGTPRGTPVGTGEGGRGTPGADGPTSRGSGVADLKGYLMRRRNTVAAWATGPDGGGPPRPRHEEHRRKSAAPAVSDEVARAVRAMNERARNERRKSREVLGVQVPQSPLPPTADVVGRFGQAKADPCPYCGRHGGPSNDPASTSENPATGAGTGTGEALLRRLDRLGIDVPLARPPPRSSLARSSSNANALPPASPSPADDRLPSTLSAVNTFHRSQPTSPLDPGPSQPGSASGLSPSPLLPYREWHIDFQELRIGVRVGIGSFGEVFRGTWRGTEVAIKILLEQDLTTENTADFCNEISLLSRLRHPNVILFMGACTVPPHLSMVTEYMHFGSVYRLIHTSGQGQKLSWRRRLKMLRDICRGMMCVARMGIVHRDLKSANCLVDRHWSVKVCDFGLSRYAADAAQGGTTAAGTPEWMAPELLRNQPVTEKCDVFSFGVIMWELCTLRRPWEGLAPGQVVYSVAYEHARLEIPPGLLGRVIADCWQESPADRPSYEEILTRLHECEFLQGDGPEKPT